MVKPILISLEYTLIIPVQNEGNHVCLLREQNFLTEGCQVLANWWQ